MTETTCTYPDRDELLVSYLYDDIEPAERTAFDAHVAACGRCRRELEQLRGVRSTLSTWAPPELRATSRQPRATSHEPPATGQWWPDIPAWAQVAAAVLVLGVSAGVANLDVRYDRAGLTVRTGWSKTSAPAVPVAALPAGSAGRMSRRRGAPISRRSRGSCGPRFARCRRRAPFRRRA